MVVCLEKLSQKMANSDHRTVYIRKVLITGIEKYEAKLKKSFLPAGNPAFQPLHLGTHYNSKGRWKKKVMAKEDWYRDGTGEKQGLGDRWQEEETIPTGWKDPNQYSNVHPIHQWRIADKDDEGEGTRVGEDHQVQGQDAGGGRDPTGQAVQHRPGKR